MSRSFTDWVEIQDQNYVFIPIQGLHPSKDPAFVAFEGECFGETFEGCVNCR